MFFYYLPYKWPRTHLNGCCADVFRYCIPIGMARAVADPICQHDNDPGNRQGRVDVLEIAPVVHGREDITLGSLKLIHLLLKIDTRPCLIH